MDLIPAHVGIPGPREQGSRLRVAAILTVAEYLLPAWLTALRSVDAGTRWPWPGAHGGHLAGCVLVRSLDLHRALRAV